MESEKLSLEALQQKAKKIKLVALDMDGTLTDGSINIGVEGELFKRFNAKDGLGITAARRHGLRVAVITGRKGVIVQRRAEELGIAEDVMTGISAKKKALQALAEKYNVLLDEIAFMGDDLNDLPALKIAGLSAAPADATIQKKEKRTDNNVICSSEDTELAGFPYAIQGVGEDRKRPGSPVLAYCEKAAHPRGRNDSGAAGIQQAASQRDNQAVICQFGHLRHGNVVHACTEQR